MCGHENYLNPILLPLIPRPRREVTWGRWQTSHLSSYLLWEERSGRWTVVWETTEGGSIAFALYSKDKIKSPGDKRDNKQIRNNTLWFILNSNKHQAWGTTNPQPGRCPRTGLIPLCTPGWKYLLQRVFFSPRGRTSPVCSEKLLFSPGSPSNYVFFLKPAEEVSPKHKESVISVSNRGLF